MKGFIVKLIVFKYFWIRDGEVGKDGGGGDDGDVENVFKEMYYRLFL